MAKQNKQNESQEGSTDQAPETTNEIANGSPEETPTEQQDPKTPSTDGTNESQEGSTDQLEATAPMEQKFHSLGSVGPQSLNQNKAIHSL